MATTDLQAHPVPGTGDPANGPSGFLALGNSLEKYTIQRYADATARDAAITDPEDGMFAVLTGGTLTMYDGTGWVIMSEPAQSYTPALTNITAGNGALAGMYHRSDGWCDFHATFTLGSTSAVSGSVTIGLPKATAGIGFGQLSVGFYDNSAGLSSLGVAYVVSATGTAVSVFAANSNTTYVGISPLASNTPFTWATGDIIDVAGRFRMNTRYL